MLAAPEKTPDRLLAAAERIVLREGGHAVSVRRIASFADENPALISYHFGGLEALLARLLAARDRRKFGDELTKREHPRDGRG